tara:strand:+ start:12322 stop:13086 length:765 start_codon:yes stop_codon:yes gene_type:complete
VQLKDKLVLITGSNRGIGLGFAREAHARGARLLLATRQPSTLKLDWADERVDSIALDMSTKESIEHFLSDPRLNDVDILINNAGQLTGGLLEDQELDQIYSMFQVNLVGLIHLTRAMMLKLIKRSESMIVNNASVSGVMHLPCTTTYTASKTGVVAFSSSLRQDLKGTNVKVLTLITPGVKTRMFDEIAPKYSNHMDVSSISSISTEEYAKRVMSAIEKKKKVLYPGGLEGLGCFLARHFPLLFEKIASSQFKR